MAYRLVLGGDEHTQKIAQAIASADTKGYFDLLDRTNHFNKKIVDFFLAEKISRYFINRGRKIYPLSGRDIDFEHSEKRIEACNNYASAIEWAWSHENRSEAFAFRGETVLGLDDMIDNGIADFTMAIICCSRHPFAYFGRARTFLLWRNKFESEHKSPDNPFQPLLPMTYEAAEYDLGKAYHLFKNLGMNEIVEIVAKHQEALKIPQ